MQNLSSMKIKTFYVSLVFSMISFHGFSQDTQEGEGNAPIDPKKKFHVGMFIGAYFANKYTADMYDGYGRDFDGKKNTFENSNMYHKIVEQYGGGYGNEDQIAIALGVGHDDWSFIEDDMPVNMHYNPAIAVGLNCKYTADKKNAIVFNLNAIKLNATGNFTIYTRPSSGATQINTSLKTFAIKGTEQRLQVQMGYQRILGENETFNFFVEGGLNATFVKFQDNLIQINNLQISLYDDNSSTLPVSSYPANKTSGVGFGVFVGLGVNLTTSTKWTLQLVCSPTLEQINIGINPRLKLQNAVGLRAYFML